MMRSILCASICALIACLGGCGGGGGGTATSSAGGPPTADPPPASQASAPSITTQPASVSLQANQAAQFSLTATGSAPLTYQWLRNGVSISGATSATYSTSATQLSDNGAQFTVVVSNSAGSVTSAAVTLTVTPTPMSAAISSTGLMPLQPFSITASGGFPAPAIGLNSMSIRYWVEYNFGSTSVPVPALIEADGSILAAAPLFGGSYSGYNTVGVRVKRSITTAPTAAALVDYSNTMTISVAPFAPLYANPGIPTQILVLIGKYLAQDAATHANALVDASTAQALQSFDFNGLAARVTNVDPTILASMDNFAAATLLQVYGYDVSTNTILSSSGGISAKQLERVRAQAQPALVGPTDIETLAKALADKARAAGDRLVDAAKVVGVGAAVVGLVMESPAILTVAGAAGLAGWVGTAAGTALGLTYDVAAAYADPSSNAVGSYKSISKSVEYFAETSTSNILDSIYNPVDGLADDVMRQKLSPTAYGMYKEGAAFVFAESSQFSKDFVAYGQSIYASGSAPAADRAIFDTSMQSDSGGLLASDLNNAEASVPSSAPSPGDFRTLSNDLDTLISVLQTLTATPQAASQYSDALNAFMSCGTPYFNDIAALGQAIAASGGTVTDAQLAQVQADAQGVITCGASLYTSLNQAAPNVSTSTSDTSNGDQVNVTAAHCDGQGCWITETTTHANGTSSTETGYRSCYSDGFCPIYLH